MTGVEELYRLYSGDVYGYLFSLVREKTVAEDLLQETFLQVIRGISRFNNDCSVKTWLFSIARHVWFNYLRKNKTQPELTVLLDITGNESIEANYANLDKVKLLMDFIVSRDEKTKHVMLLRVEGFSFLEIAAKLNISEGSARVVFHRGKVSAKSFLEENGYE